MAQAQKWTRNINKKLKGARPPLAARPFVNSDQIEKLKRRAEDLGLIIHAGAHGRKKDGKK